MGVMPHPTPRLNSFRLPIFPSRGTATRRTGLNMENIFSNHGAIGRKTARSPNTEIGLSILKEAIFIYTALVENLPMSLKGRGVCCRDKSSLTCILE